MPTAPEWIIPADLHQCLDANDGIWEDNRWDPIVLTVMRGTSHGGRDIPLSWEIEFEPSDGRDGDQWAEVIYNEYMLRHPKRIDELHLDAESSTCVIWVESEEACRRLLDIAWPLAHAALQ